MVLLLRNAHLPTLEALFMINAEGGERRRAAAGASVALGASVLSWQRHPPTPHEGKAVPGSEQGQQADAVSVSPLKDHGPPATGQPAALPTQLPGCRSSSSLPTMSEGVFYPEAPQRDRG